MKGREQSKGIRGARSKVFLVKGEHRVGPTVLRRKEILTLVKIELRKPVIDSILSILKTSYPSELCS